MILQQKELKIIKQTINKTTILLEAGMNYKTTNYISLDEVNNNSICVLTENGIRKMSESGDINEPLVYVCNIPMIDQHDNDPIEKGRWCRCIECIPILKPQI